MSHAFYATHSLFFSRIFRFISVIAIADPMGGGDPVALAISRGSFNLDRANFCGNNNWTFGSAYLLEGCVC